MRMRTVIIAAIAALAATGAAAQGASPQGTSSPTPGVSPEESARLTFCNDAEALYREILMTQPTIDKPSPTAPITYSAYRQGGTLRVLQLVTSARCNLTPFLNIERDYLIKSMRPNKPYQPYGTALQSPSSGGSLSPIQPRR